MPEISVVAPRLQEEMLAAHRRITELEAALRKIADRAPLIGGDAAIMRNIAREALTK